MKLKGLFARPWAPVGAIIDLKNVTISIKDGSTTPNSIEIKIGEGNLTYTESRNVEYILDKGSLDEVRLGDEVPMDVAFDFVWDLITGSSGTGVPTVEEALKNTGEAASWVSTDADTCRPYAVDIELLNAPVPITCGDKETFTLSDFRYESLDHDLRAGSVAVSGRCNVKEATIVRATQ